MILIIILLLIISGMARAVADKINFHYDESIFFGTSDEYYWNPEISHLNKYFGHDSSLGPAFWGSTTVFVWLTDGWHLFTSISRISMCGAFYLMGTNLPWWTIIIGYAFSMAVFELFFKKILHAD